MSYFWSRITRSLGIIWGIVTLLFLIFYALGDPAGFLVEEKADTATRQAVLHKYGLDRPVGVQYLLYLNRLLPLGWIPLDEIAGQPHLTLFSTNNGLLALKFPVLGTSFVTGQPVDQVIGARLEGTAWLALVALAIAIVLGIPLGVVAAVFPRTWIDRSILGISVLGISAPSFFVGVLVMWFFAVKFQSVSHLPVSGYMFQENIFSNGRHVDFRYLLLPAISLGIRPLAVFVQLTRSAMLDALKEQYVRTARAKGLSRWQVVVFHALRNALTPVATSITGWLASLLAGAFFIEYIFNWPGIGQLTIQALETRDLPVILGCALLVGVIFTVINLFTDLLYKWLDPRVK